MIDNVNNPPHYKQGEVETIDGIRAALGGGFVIYCRGNVLKYVWRCGKKGDAIEDLRKAAKYLQWAIEALESDDSENQCSSHVEGVWVEEAGKIEPAEWIPKVGDKVRVIKPLKTNIKHPHWPPEMDKWNGRVGVVSKSNLELGTVLIDGFHDGSGYQWRFSFNWLRYEGGTSEAAQ